MLWICILYCYFGCEKYVPFFMDDIRHFGNECKVAVNSAGAMFPLIEIVIPCKTFLSHVSSFSAFGVAESSSFFKKVCIYLFGFMGLNCRMWDLFFWLLSFLKKLFICFNWRIITL